MDDNPGIRRTNYVVFGLMAIGLAILAVRLAGIWGGLALAALLAYEIWTLLDRWAANSISEIIWVASARPLVPWMFGVLTGWAIQSGVLHNEWLIGVWFMLNGHFFFQAQDKLKAIQKERVVLAANTGFVGE